MLSFYSGFSVQTEVCIVKREGKLESMDVVLVQRAYLTLRFYSGLTVQTWFAQLSHEGSRNVWM